MGLGTKSAARNQLLKFVGYTNGTFGRQISTANMSQSNNSQNDKKRSREAEITDSMILRTTLTCEECEEEFIPFEDVTCEVPNGQMVWESQDIDHVCCKDMSGDPKWRHVSVHDAIRDYCSSVVKKRLAAEESSNESPKRTKTEGQMAKVTDSPNCLGATEAWRIVEECCADFAAVSDDEVEKIKKHILLCMYGLNAVGDVSRAMLGKFNRVNEDTISFFFGFPRPDGGLAAGFVSMDKNNNFSRV